MNKRNNILHNLMLLFFGTFSLTQVHVIGYLGISELVMFVCAPFVLINDIQILKRDGFMPFLWLVFLAMLGCSIGAVVNGAFWGDFLRGFAALYACIAIPVVLHRCLRNNLSGLNWVLFGIAISTFLTIFFFKKEAELGIIANGIDNAIEHSMSSPLFWSSKLKPWIMLPTMAFYYKTPLMYSWISPLLVAIIALFCSEGGTGRSVALTALMSSIFIIAGGKKQIKMFKLGRHVILFIVSLIFVMFLFKTFYSYLAESGMLGDAAEKKYAHQTRSGTGVINLIMGGRSEVGVCMLACRDKPILGHGPWAMDTNGYWAEYLENYGIVEDYVRYIESSMKTTGGNIIPTHSILFGAWVWYGIFGALLWLYVLWLLFVHIRKTIFVIPQWFGYFAISIPMSVWHIFFSPFGDRFGILLLVTCVILVRAVSRGTIKLPHEMQCEIAEHEKR